MNHALMASDRWREQLIEIKTPTLVIHGTEDPVLPYGHGVALAREIPGATLLTLEKTGHEVHRADWETIVAAVLRHTFSNTAHSA
jgi:pimeloyl-ACP methyl ester carboxylesterase